MNRSRIAAITLAGTLTLGVPATMIAASSPSAGASTATLSTTSRTETLTSGRCYHEVQVTRTYFGWSTKAGHYVRYVSPRITTTVSTHCHS